MGTSDKKTFVGFGFGPIQAGLFLYEAYASNHFERFVVAEIDDQLVRSVRANSGRYTVNIARKDRIDRFELKGIEIYSPRQSADREALIDAVAVSDELATALPSVNVYNAGEVSSVVSIIAAGLAKRSARLPTVIYAAENHNRAAEILREHIERHPVRKDLTPVQVLNTVIGKMSGVIGDAGEIQRIGLNTITADLPRAILVEEFNRILISRVRLPGYRRGIDVFIEKDDLLPFEEAKLYGHNAIHALIAYLADLRGFHTIAQAGNDGEIMAIARRAFIEESGATLIKRHEKLGDPLFTTRGYRHYAEDLLERMICPNLNDLVARVGRDHVRKLGYEDRLFGTMRLALQYGIEPVNLALGAAAGVVSLIKRRGELRSPIPSLPPRASELSEGTLKRLLLDLWGGEGRVDAYGDKMIALTADALQGLGDKGMTNNT